MKIKKVAQTPGVIATVSTSKIDSDKDTYSCNYLNDNAVVVSPTEPSDGKVWLQKGKNLFDKNNYNLWNGWINESDNTFTANSKGYLVYIPCSPNTTYIVSREVLEDNFKVGVADKIPVHQGTLTNVINNPYGNSITITSGANDRYLHIYVHYTDDNTDYTLEQILDSLRVEIPKKIYTKNDNGVYEEFYNEENREVYSTGETRIGTWIDGKPLYRKTIHSTSTTGSLGVDFDFIRFKDFSALIDGKFLLPVARYTGTTDHLDFSINVVNKTFNFTLSDAWSGKFTNMTFDIEYTKTTD